MKQWSEQRQFQLAIKQHRRQRLREPRPHLYGLSLISDRLILTCCDFTSRGCRNARASGVVPPRVHRSRLTLQPVGLCRRLMCAAAVAIPWPPARRPLHSSATQRCEWRHLVRRHDCPKRATASLEFTAQSHLKPERRHLQECTSRHKPRVPCLCRSRDGVAGELSVDACAARRVGGAAQHPRATRAAAEQTRGGGGQGAREQPGADAPLPWPLGRPVCC